LRIINAAMTPDTQSQSVSRNTMSIEPQLRSITAIGGKIMVRMGDIAVVNLCDSVAIIFGFSAKINHT
jgi:hypothetical protein